MRLSRPLVLVRPWLCSLLLLDVSLTAIVAAEPRVAVSEGHLATAAEGSGTWSLLATGDSLSDSALFRTSGAGIVAIADGSETLTFGPLTSGRWDSNQRNITLDRGRLLIVAGNNAHW